MTNISVLIEQGRVKAVEGIPMDVSVEVKNYDVDCLDKGGLSKDEDGRSAKFGSGTHRNKWSG
jgi:hypothetical protein